MRTKTILPAFLFLFIVGFFFVTFLRADDYISLNSNSVSVSAERLAEGLQGTVRKGRADIPQALPVLNGLPPHLRLAFDEDQLSENINPLERQLVIFPIENYRNLFRGKKRKLFDRQMEVFRYMIKENIAENMKSIPIYPPLPAQQKFHSQTKKLQFQEGSGVRFLCAYGLDEKTPIASKDIFYTFQGITRDGKYLVAFFYPVIVRSLPVTGDASTVSVYMDQILPESFSPALDRLDSIVQSITFESRLK